MTPVSAMLMTAGGAQRPDRDVYTGSRHDAELAMAEFARCEALYKLTAASAATKAS